MSGFQIRVPATSANLGPGFDSVGIALSKFVTLDCQPGEDWFFSVPVEDQPYIPSGKSNLIYKTALQTAEAFGYETLPPTHVELTNDVPIARGLGSSSTAVVGGIELADQLLNLKLTKYDKFKIACEIEGHPDNVGPAIYGGIMVSNYDGDHLDYVHFTEGLDGLTWLAIVPSYHLETEKARGLLPTEIDYKQAVNNSGSANVLIAALATKDWVLAGKMMKSDRWHQPYRQALIPGFSDVTEALEYEGSLGHYISGAGPTMVAVFDEWSAAKESRLKGVLPSYLVEPLQVHLTGAETFQKKMC
ncbi:homoserine kinase [Halobacillus litoralis]|uniref:Homoserine kinase n=1 Tax=Halobacillus litoralis TaxID=45668 RepID=A0A410MFA9_9BACI|nr:homoserine kinase [Halobacillus litoralis]QAS53393.1 homoserine kinase [Halobacillus litoralis]